jgi:hypothetical protein
MGGNPEAQDGDRAMDEPRFGCANFIRVIASMPVRIAG